MHAKLHRDSAYSKSSNLEGNRYLLCICNEQCSRRISVSKDSTIKKKKRNVNLFGAQIQVISSKTRAIYCLIASQRNPLSSLILWRSRL